MDAKPGWFSKRIETFQSVMVFRKALMAQTAEIADVLTATPPPIQVTADPETPVLTAVEDEPDTKFEFTADSDAPTEPQEQAEPSEEQDVTFDSENMDPLKYAVEANRKPDPSE